MYKYLVTFMWYQNGKLEIKAVKLKLENPITTETDTMELLDKVDKWEFIPKNEFTEMIAFSKYE